MKNNYYVYMYTDPRTNEPFYVGLSKNEKRMFDHLNEAKKSVISSNLHKYNKIKKILSCGSQPIIQKIDENLTKEEACELEIFLISFIGRSDLRKGSLTNLTDGGEGTKQLSKISEDKKRKTCNAKYGVDYPMQSKAILEKSRNTCSDRYGVQYYSQTEEHKEKAKKTNLSKYGTEHATQSTEIQEKMKKTCTEKYGVQYYSQTEEHRESHRKRFNLEYKNGTHWMQNNSEKISENTKRQVLDGKHPFTTEEHRERQRKICQEKNREMNKRKLSRENVKILKELYVKNCLVQPRGGIWVKSDLWINEEISRLGEVK